MFINRLNKYILRDVKKGRNASISEEETMRIGPGVLLLCLCVAWMTHAVSPLNAAETLPGLGSLALEKGEIETRLSLDFLTGGNFFDDGGNGRTATDGIVFTEGKATVDLAYGLTSNLTVRASVPYVRRSQTYPELSYQSGECYCLGQTTSVDFYYYAPAGMEHTGIGDITLEAAYRVFTFAEFLAELGVRVGSKLAVGSDEVNYDRNETNLGDGQHDLILGVDGRGGMKWLAYEFSLEYRMRFEGSYRITDRVGSVTQSFYPHYDPGDEFSAKTGGSVRYEQLTVGVSAQYIYTAQSETWLEGYFENTVEEGYYLQITPGVGVLPSEDSVVSFSIEIPLKGKNYPRDIPYFHYQFHMNFLYRL